MPYVFVDGAMEMELLPQDGERWYLQRKPGKGISTGRDHVPKKNGPGLVLCAGEGITLNPLNYWRQHSQYFHRKPADVFKTAVWMGKKRSILHPQMAFISCEATVFIMSVTS